MITNNYKVNNSFIGSNKASNYSLRNQKVPYLSPISCDLVTFKASNQIDNINGNKIVGRTIFTDPKTHKSFPVAITKENNGPYEILRIVDISTNDPDPMGIGWMKIQTLQNSDTKIYGNNKILFIEKMAKIDEELSGVGTLLHQIAIERSIQLGLDGRIELSPDYNSHAFHFLSGYRSSITHNDGISPEEFDLRLQELINSAKQNNQKVDLTKLLQETNCGFYLPKTSFEQWKTRISSNPILNKQ